MTPDTVPLRDYLEVKFEGIGEHMDDVRSRLERMEGTMGNLTTMVANNSRRLDDLEDPDVAPLMTAREGQLLRRAVGIAVGIITTLAGMVWAVYERVWKAGVLSVLAVLLTGCATFAPSRVLPSVAPLVVPDGGTCTAWAVAADRWVTVGHCARRRVLIGGVPSDLLAVDVDADVALFLGPVGAVPLAVAESAPPLGAPVTIYGFGLGRDPVLFFHGTLISPRTDFFANGRQEMLIGTANGLPGMSGGPVLWRGRVVGLVTGGGTADSPLQLLGTAVSWGTLRTFLAAHLTPAEIVIR